MACVFHHRLIENMVRVIAAKNQELIRKVEVISKKTLREKILAYLSLQMCIRDSYKELKEYLQKKGFVFLSETDTEVVAHLLDYYYKGNPLEAIARALGRIRGSYALGILFKDQPGDVYKRQGVEDPMIGTTGLRFAMQGDYKDGQNFLW